MKPENCLLDKDKNILIVDFGLSNIYNKENQYLNTACGSPCYAPPEMLAGLSYEGLKVINKIIRLIFGLQELFYLLYFVDIYLLMT